MATFVLHKHKHENCSCSMLHHSLAQLIVMSKDFFKLMCVSLPATRNVKTLTVISTVSASFHP